MRNSSLLRVMMLTQTSELALVGSDKNLRTPLQPTHMDGWIDGLMDRSIDFDMYYVLSISLLISQLLKLP